MATLKETAKTEVQIRGKWYEVPFNCIVAYMRIRQYDDEDNMIKDSKGRSEWMTKCDTYIDIDTGHPSVEAFHAVEFIGW